METSKEIIEKLRGELDLITPGKLSEYKIRLALEYGHQSELIAEILKEKASRWLEIRQRPETESDKMAERIWETTEQGKNETVLRLTMKGLEKVISAVSSRLTALANEQRNNS